MVTATKDHVNGAKEIQEVSHYLEFLPAPYRDRENEFMGRFLLIFESIMDPLFNTVDNMALYFDPRLIPASLLPWLATWVDQTLDPAWPRKAAGARGQSFRTLPLAGHSAWLNRILKDIYR